MIRRDLLAALPFGALPVLAAGCGPAEKEPSEQQTDQASDELEETMTNRKLEKFGLQLSTITPLLLADFEGTLERVAAIGYRQVEFSAAGFLGRPVERVVELLEANGLKAPVGRISPKLPDNFAAMSRDEQRAAFREFAAPEYLLENVRWGLDHANALGQKHLVLPALMPDNFTTRARVDESLDLLRQAGELCAASGVQFGYHNHDWEFASVDGVVPYDLMLETIEPELMAYQIDVYWVVKGGRDPLEYLSAHPGRFPTCHLKDIDDEGDFEDVGYGNIDFPEFVAAAMDAGTEYYFVERDGPPEPMRTAERAYAYLAQMTY